MHYASHQCLDDSTTACTDQGYHEITITNISGTGVITLTDNECRAFGESYCELTYNGGNACTSLVGCNMAVSDGGLGFVIDDPNQSCIPDCSAYTNPTLFIDTFAAIGDQKCVSAGSCS